MPLFAGACFSKPVVGWFVGCTFADPLKVLSCCPSLHGHRGVSLSEMPTARDSAAAVSVRQQHEVVVMGGWDGSYKAEVEILDVRAGKQRVWLVGWCGWRVCRPCVRRRRRPAAGLLLMWGERGREGRWNCRRVQSACERDRWIGLARHNLRAWFRVAYVRATYSACSR